MGSHKKKGFTSYEARGDELYVDISHLFGYFTWESFIKDGLDHTLDISAFVPVGATAVNIQCRGSSSDGNGVIYLKIPGANPLGTCHIRPQVADKDISMHSVIGLDSTRTIIYNFTGATINDFALRIKGYFKPA